MLAVSDIGNLGQPSHSGPSLIAGQRESEGVIELRILGPLVVMMSVEAGVGTRVRRVPFLQVGCGVAVPVLALL